MKKIVKITKSDAWIGCFAYKINLVVTVGLNNSMLKGTIKEMRKVTTKYGENKNMQASLAHITPKSIINAPSNRWFHSLAESVRFLELKDAITTVQERWGFHFEHSDFDQILIHKNLLKPFEI